MPIEVLSPMTEAYDRGRKSHDYQTIESLQDYVLIAQDTPRVERFSRSTDIRVFYKKGPITKTGP